MRSMSLAFATLAVLAGIAGCKGDRNKCEEACRNYGTLSYWHKADAEIAAAPEAEREALKKKKLVQFTHHLEEGVEACISQCVSANNDEQIDCLIGAKTADVAKACVADD